MMSTAKAILHISYAQCEKQPRYETEPIFAEKEGGNGLLASANFLVKPPSQQQIGYRCTLFLPDFPPVVSDVFSRKKEAEQDAAKKALTQMGKSKDDDLQPKVLSTEEKLIELAERIEALFSEKVVMNNHLFKEHFKAAMRRKDGRSGSLPVGPIAAFDNKISSLCKSLHESSESGPLFSVAMVWEVAKRCSLVKREKGFFIRRKEPFSSQFQAEFLGSENEGESYFKFQAVYIPSQDDECVKSIEIEFGPQEYYLDALSTKLRLTDEAALMISRSITRAPHGTRLYCAIPDVLMEVKCLGPICNEHMMIEFPGNLMHSALRNNRASDIIGFSVYGDAILASVGPSRKLEGRLCSDDVSLSCYHRLALGRRPEGNYRLSRNAPLVAKMPCTFSSRSQWRGKLPFSLLIDFCQQHQLPNPEFYFSVKSSCGLPTAAKEKETKESVSYKCRTKIVYQGKDLVFESERLYRNRTDARHSAALQASLFLSIKSNKCENDSKSDYGECLERDESIRMSGISRTKACHNGVNFPNGIDKVHSESNMTTVAGSMVSISCVVWLISHNKHLSLETHEEFEFELGIGGILPELENCILGMQVGASEQLFLPVPCVEGLLATQDVMTALGGFIPSPLPLLRYDIKLLKTLEPPEERMESALFSPPLSRQRNEFAIQKIKEIGAKSLVDLGCGSGSLLDAAVGCSTDLELVAGVDISQKSLIRAAKSLCGKLDVHEDHPNRNLKKVVLYKGSLADIDIRLCNFDVATCIEVVEHMDPDPLLKAGENILGKYAPKLLILSTPNIEYNGILQKVTSDSKTNSGDNKPFISDYMAQDDLTEVALRSDLSERTPAMGDVPAANISEDDPRTPTVKLRNDDHRFEWTRAEFAEWADNLASKFGYTVEYSGVGGSAEDPGYASQIAVFTRNHHCYAINDDDELDQPKEIGRHATSDSEAYTVVWKYDKEVIPLDTI